MKSLALSLLLLLALPATAFAQQEPATTEPALSKARGNKVGIGLSIEPSTTLLQVGGSNDMISFFPVALRVPVNFGSIKLEPELAVLSIATDVESGGESVSDRGTVLRFGSGIYFNTPVTSEASVYVGPKLGIVQISSKEESTFSNVSQTVERSRTNIFFAGMVGGEYYFSQRFSIGAEIGLEYQTRGTEDVTETPADPFPSQNPDRTEGGFMLSTKAGLTARFYF